MIIETRVPNFNAELASIINAEAPALHEWHVADISWTGPYHGKFILEYTVEGVYQRKSYAFRVTRPYENWNKPKTMALEVFK